jgi:prophage antirepressor-like protein
MSKALQVFRYDANEIRVAMIDEDGNPWFVAKDVCDALDLTYVSKSIEDLDSDEKGRTTVPTLGGPQEMSTVNESGLYSLVLRSRKPEAKAFKRWITREVLPQIRKTGRYEPSPPVMDELGMIQTQALAIARMVDDIRESKKVSVEASKKADEAKALAAAASAEAVASTAKAASAEAAAAQNALQLIAMVDRQHAALASIPSLPAPSLPAIPRTTRDNVVEVLRYAAIRLHAEHGNITTRAYRELRTRHGLDALRRLQNLKKQRGNSHLTGLDVVERHGLMEELYAICVELFGRPIDPLPNAAVGSEG